MDEEDISGPLEDQGPAAPQVDPEIAAKFDLTSEMSQYMDRHLVFPLLEFLQVTQLYPDEDILQAKMKLLQSTNMVDFAMDIYRHLHNLDPPTEMIERRAIVVQNLKRLRVEASKVVSFLQDASKVAQLRTADRSFNLQYLQENHDIGASDIDALYHYAKFQFECGNYSQAGELLYHYRTLSTDTEKSFQALWGKLAAEVLMQNWEQALEDMNRLKELIDNKSYENPLMQLQQRSWLMHWSLFVFFNRKDGRAAVVDLFLQDRYLNAIQTGSQHLLRYLATAVICNKRRKSTLQDVVRVIQQEAQYKDPITEFLVCLYSSYDFDMAQEKLRECEHVLASDYFLVGCREEFIANARMFIFEAHCRIHRTIDMKTLAQKLNMGDDDAETWIVNLVREAKLNAKIDSDEGTVVMGMQYPAVYEQLVSTASALSQRTARLAASLQGRMVV